MRGYRLPVAGYLFLRVDDPACARAWLADIASNVLTATPWSVKPESGVNLALSYAGLVAMGVPSASLAGFPQEYRDGMAARAVLLGDTGDSSPQRWEAPFADGSAHVLLMISAQSRDHLAAHDASLRADLERVGGLTIVGEQIGGALPGGKEHFGYLDGLAQPAIEGSGLDPRPGQGAPGRNGTWRAIRAGEFILGYPDEEGVLPAAPPPDELSANGSYLVYRKLHQDVAAFRRQLTAAAAYFPGGAELLAAKIVGRWRDGTPVDAAPTDPDPVMAADPEGSNGFSYAGDPDGMRCPVGAHVRRANPRESLPFGGKLVNRHRIVRRGIPYGDPLAPGADDGRERGLIFTRLQASIARQFEFIQSQWLGDGNVFGLGADQDVLLGTHDGPEPSKMTVPGRPPCFVGPLSRVVRTCGGEYFFAPGINGLHYLAALPERAN